MKTREVDGGVIDIEKTTLLLEPENSTEGGLSVPGKDRPVFRPPERRSHLGLDVLANAKRGGSNVNGFKIPKQSVASFVSSMEEEETLESSGVIDSGKEAGISQNNTVKNRNYREIASDDSNEGSTLAQATARDSFKNPNSSEISDSSVITMSSKSTHVSRYRSPRQDYDNRDRQRKDFDNDSRSNNRRGRHGHSYDGEEHYYGRSRYQKDHDRENERKRSRYESSRRTPENTQRSKTLRGNFHGSLIVVFILLFLENPDENIYLTRAFGLPTNCEYCFGHQRELWSGFTRE